MKLVPLFGSGKGGGGGRSPIEAPNTLRSKSIVRVVDMLGEGPIDGFCTIDGYPIIDCLLMAQPEIVNGTLYYDDAKWPVVGGCRPSLVSSASAGYRVAHALPSSAELEIPCYVDGDGTEAEIVAVVWPTGPGNGTYYPEGRVKGLKVKNVGKNYTKATVYLPPASGTAIFFDDIPVVHPVYWTFNYRNAHWQYRFGSATQEPMEDFNRVEELLDWTIDEVREDQTNNLPEFGGVASGTRAPLSVAINGNYDELSVNVYLSQGLYMSNVQNGDVYAVVSPRGISFKITQQWVVNGIPSAEMDFGQGTYELLGKTTSPYVRTITAKLYRPSNSTDTTGHWIISIRRLSIDDDSTKQPDPKWRFFTRFGVTGGTKTRYVRLSYPYCALIGLSVDASQFNSVPARTYRMRMLRILVPSNYFPPKTQRADGSFRQYAEYNRLVADDGTVTEAAEDQPWDGTFYESWTDNPAWVFYTLCTHQRVGLGRYLPGADKWAMYRIARYCDELVPTGYSEGSGYSAMEPRFTFNGIFQANEEAWQALSQAATVFRGLLYWAGGQVVADYEGSHTIIENGQREAKKVKKLFTPSNTQGFNYQGTARKVRHTVAVLQYSNPDDGYKLATVYVENTEAVLRYGYNVLDLTAFACASRGQARRVGRYALLTEASCTDVCTFTTGVDGVLMRPNDRIQIQDPVRASVNFSGRVVALDQDSSGRGIITLDRPLSSESLGVSPIESHCLVLSRPSIMPSVNDIQSEEDLAKFNVSMVTTDEEGRVSSYADDAYGRTKVILKGGVPAGVSPGAVWLLKLEAVKPQDFRVLSIVEKQRDMYEISALEWHPEVFDTVDRDAPYSEEPINPSLDSWKLSQPPRNLTLKASVVSDADGVRFWKLHVSWSPPLNNFSKGYKVYMSRGLGNFQLVTENAGETSVELEIRAADTYSVQVVSVGLNNSISVPLGPTTLFVGDTSAFNDEIISGLEIRGQGNNTTFSTGSVIVDWRVNWSAAKGAALDTSLPPTIPPLIKEYLIKIVAPDGRTLAEYRPKETHLTITRDMNLGWPDGPHRDFIVEAQAITANGVSRTSSLRLTNPRPDVPSDATVSAEGHEQIVVRFNRGYVNSGAINVLNGSLKVEGIEPDWTDVQPGWLLEVDGDFYTVASIQLNDDLLVLTVPYSGTTHVNHPYTLMPAPYADLDSYLVWVSTTSGFTPNESTLAAKGNNTTLTVTGVAAGVKHYVRLGVKDSLARGNLDVNIGPEIEVTPIAVSGTSALAFFRV